MFKEEAADAGDCGVRVGKSLHFLPVINDIIVHLGPIMGLKNKFASLEASLVRNYHSLTHRGRV